MVASLTPPTSRVSGAVGCGISPAAEERLCLPFPLPGSKMSGYRKRMLSRPSCVLSPTLAGAPVPGGRGFVFNERESSTVDALPTIQAAEDPDGRLGALNGK